MNRTVLVDRILPNYTKGEEIFNMVTHIVGAATGVAATALCIVFASIHHNVYGIVSTAIYGFTLILLYTMSSIYHGLSPKLLAKKVFQIIDHCSIFLLIAGTYTPLALSAIRSVNPVIGWLMFGIIWFVAVVGIILNSIDLKCYSKFSQICYLLMGWSSLLSAKILYSALGTLGCVFLVSGGLMFSIGAALYAVGKKKKYFHSIFHLFVVFGTILHFFCIFFCCV